MKKVKLAVLVSGSGTNLESLINAVNSGIIKDGQISLVISNKETAYALKRAENAGIPSFIIKRSSFDSNEDFDKYLLEKLIENKIEIVLLAGYMRILTKPLLDAYKDKILNIHPSLLPDFGGAGMYGIKAHEAVIKAGVTISGCSVHVVNEHIDGGPVIAQSRIKVMPEDTPQSLAKKVLIEEHKLYPATVQNFISTQVQL
ncbi:MAG TPA: phosphoribosylglycinamide formyltransferase [Candidatus Gastranaerophilales bacterium]|nr:phosphoribosylglycinamide formyltransferase [Candidatus Gastranaerophilales bacterium]